MLRILLVEDDRATRDGYRVFLTEQGFQVLTATSGRQALAQATSERPDLVVLDLGLPDIDGWEVARQLKSEPATLSLPIIALTGAALPHERASAMRAGCDWHLSKPCTPRDLLEVIRRALGHAT
jgi:two-component system, cell cycle response regulator DivK